MAPITTRRRRLAVETRLWRVYLDDIATPEGALVDDYLVLEPKTRSSGSIVYSGVAVLPVVEGRFGLLSIYRHAMSETFLEVPRGFVDTGELPAVSAARELEEETGLIADPASLLPLGSIVPEASTFVGRAGLFAAENCMMGANIRDVRHEPGIGDFCFFDLAEVHDLVASSRIEDPATLVAFYRYVALKGL
ncbi:MAG: NUDIX hydrolase [Alphaproteobacteria bacterium]|nr:NUDIX hydrolase [Alphaproteobacteria bacterium]